MWGVELVPGLVLTCDGYRDAEAHSEALGVPVLVSRDGGAWSRFQLAE